MQTGTWGGVDAKNVQVNLNGRDSKSFVSDGFTFYVDQRHAAEYISYTKARDVDHALIEVRSKEWVAIILVWVIPKR